MLGLTPDQDPAKDGVPLDPPPSTRQGFGRMQLSSSLPLPPLGSFSMQVCASKLHIAAYWATPSALIYACIAFPLLRMGKLQAVCRSCLYCCPVLHHEQSFCLYRR